MFIGPKTRQLRYQDCSLQVLPNGTGSGVQGVSIPCWQGLGDIKHTTQPCCQMLGDIKHTCKSFHNTSYGMKIHLV